MAKLTITTNEDIIKVRYDSLKEGEVFIYNEPHMKYNPEFSLDLADGSITHFKGDDLVTYVEKAELKLTV